MFLSTISEKTRKRDLRGEMAQGISHTAIILFAEKGWFLGALSIFFDARKKIIPNVLKKLNYNTQSISITNIQC